MTRETHKLLRNSKVSILVRSFGFYFVVSINESNETHCLEKINCVRWDHNGERLASTSDDGNVKVLDFASGRVTYTGKTEDGSNLLLLVYS